MPPNSPTEPKVDRDALERVLVRAQQAWVEPVAQVWMRSPNSHLSGARPIDVLALRGPDEVLDALDATIAGGYA